MWKLIAAVALSMPVAANAGLLFLEYEGTVTKIQGCLCPHLYSLGDPVRGVLTIHTALAPPDDRPGDATWGMYSAGASTPDFILGPVHLPGRPRIVGDAVTVFNDAQLHPEPQGYDTLQVQSGFIGSLDSPGSDAPLSVTDLLRVDVVRNTAHGQLFADDGLVQSFDVTPDEGTNLNAYLTRIVSGAGRFVRQEFTFGLTRVSLGSCPRSAG